MTKTIDFEDLSSGTVVDNEYSSLGVTISGITAQGAGGRAMIFDTENPSGGDKDLASDTLGKVLILSEDGDQTDPDDNTAGGTVRFAFETPAVVHAMTFLDLEEGAHVEFFDDDDVLIDAWYVDTPDSTPSMAVFGAAGVAYFDVKMMGSGAIDSLVFDDLMDLDGTVEGTFGDDIITVDTAYRDEDGDMVDAADAILPDAAGPDSDLIVAGSGNDSVDAGADDDLAYGDDGNDSLTGGSGNDVLFGGNDDDRVAGDAGHDELFGGYGADDLTGGTGDDALYGGRGADTLNGGAGADRVDGGNDADLIIGGAGDLVIGGADGDDYDTLDLRGMGDFVLTGPDGTGEPVPDSNGNGLDGCVLFVDAEGEPTGEMIAFREIETFLADPVEGPLAQDDSYSGDEDTVALLGNVLANDLSQNGLRVVAVSGEATAVGEQVMGHRGGLITIAEDGALIFDPNAGFDALPVGATTVTSLTYTIADAQGQTAEAVVSIAVEGRNDGPIATPDNYVVRLTEDFGPAEAKNAITDNTGAGADSDIDGDAITIVAVAGSPDKVGQPVAGTGGGLFTVTADGDVDFDPNGEFDDLEGHDTAISSVSYTIADENGAEASSVITFMIFGDGTATVVGTDEDDEIITGMPGAPDVGYPFQQPLDGGANTLPFPGYAADSNPFDQRDVVFGGAGDDTIRAGDDNDIVFGDSGDDAISGGFDDDLIFGGTGDDLLEGAEGNDKIDGGTGNDVIYGGLEDTRADLVSFPDDAPDANGFQDLVPENNGDELSGGEGDDRIYGQDDDDTLFGGAGDDLLDGGVDDDLIEGGLGDDVGLGGQGNDNLRGGEGDDVLVGGDGADVLQGGAGDDAVEGGAGNDLFLDGAGADAMFGGAGDDLFQGATDGDVVIGGEDADGQDFDVLNLETSDVSRIEYTSADRESGRVVFTNGNAMTFAEIEEVVPCFTPGTLIATPRGERLIEDLRVGDRIITRDNGIQQIAWIGRKTISGRELVQNPHLRPVLIRRGALGQGLPERDMMVSPNHRMLVSSEKTQLYFEENEVLAAAKHMVGADGIHTVDAMRTTYIHFLFERHEVVLANGAWSESFQPGDYTLKGLGGGQRREIFEIFPELATESGREDYHAARKSLKGHETKLLLD